MAVEAKVLCENFVSVYYNVLDEHPQEAHKFYKDCSTLSRPDAGGVLTTVSSMHGINEKILSLSENERKVHVKSADALNSLDGGVIILVTGSVSGLDVVQTFFLARQEVGYFILTDILKYIDIDEPNKTVSEKEDLIGNQMNKDYSPPVNSAAQASTIQDKPEPAAVMKTVATNTSEELIKGNSSQSHAAAHTPASQVGSKLAVEEVNPKMSFKAALMQKTTQLPPKVVPHDKNMTKVASTKASKQPAETTASSVVSNTTDKTKLASTKASKQPSETTASSVTSNTTDKTTPAALQSGEGASYSIYLSGLPPNMTASELEKECSIFGPVAPDGVRIRTKPDGFSFGFVAFVNESSVQEVLQASPILIWDKPIYVQIKKSGGPNGGGSINSRDGYGAGGGSGRDGYYRNESFRRRPNDGYWEGYSDGDSHRGYYRSTSARQNDGRSQQDRRTGVPPYRSRQR